MAAKSLTYQYKTANIVTKIIVINAAIFLIVRLAAFFMRLNPIELTRWFALPENISDFITQPWSILTYAFIHHGFFHVFFNMYMLYWFGRIVLNLFNAKRFLTVYLLGVISGGVLYMLAYNIFPVFANSNGILYGASAGVTAVMIFIATYTPNTEVMIIKWRVKLWQIGLTIFLLDLVRISVSENAGGLLSHVGGAIFGYFYAIQMAKGNDIGKWFENIMDWVEGLFLPKKKKPFKKVHRTKSAAPRTKPSAKDVSEHQKKVDAILDKIGKSGYDSLTKAEKDFLFKAGKQD